MKKIAVSLVLAAGLCLAACEQEEQRLPGGDDVVVEEVGEIDEPCPRADGEPCR